MWGELPKFNDYKHQQQIKKEKQDKLAKREQFLQTLDQQIN
jgi:hypothetical protein